MLAAAVGPHLTKYLHDQYDLMFSAGLSEPLVQALAAIVHSIPPVLGTIQEKLLNQLSLILSGQPFYKPLGAPSALPPDTSASSKELGAPGATVEKNPEIIALALNTLWSFDFSGMYHVKFSMIPLTRYYRTTFERVRADQCNAVPRGRQLERSSRSCADMLPPFSARPYHLANKQPCH